MAMGKRLRIMRRFHLARAAVLTRVSGLGKRVVALGRLGTVSGFKIRTHAVNCLRKDGRDRFRQGLGTGSFHMFSMLLGSVVLH